MKNILLLACLFFANSASASNSLVSPATIEQQKKLTKIYYLKNHLPIIYRSVPDSDIIQIHVSFKSGLRDLPAGEKPAGQLLFETMPLAASSFPKELVFKITEKYALALDCSSGIEISTCALGTINDYWDKGLDLFAALIKTPSLDQTDIDVKRQQIMAEVKGQTENPSSLANDGVNRIFYPAGHPYFQTFEDTLKELPKIDRSTLLKLHKKILNASNMSITVATSLPADQVLAVLDKQFGAIPSEETHRAPVQAPAYKKDWVINFVDKKIPTAYIQLKFNAKNATDKDAVATKLMFNVLDEELGDEIRTKRSLSYSVFSYTIQYDMGIGNISATTSKPKETLEAINEVIKKLKTHDYTRRELEEYKGNYATNYFLTQEEHGSLAAAISTAYNYNGSPDFLYELPRTLDKATPRDIKRLANELLINFRVGVVYDRNKFKDSWAKDLVKKNRG